MDENGPSRDSAPRIDVAHSRGRFAGVVSLVGEHDLATRERLDDALDRVSGSVLVDLSECRFLDSSVIGTLVTHARRVTSDGHRFEAVVPPANTVVTRVVDVCGLRELIAVHDATPG
jgi:anti-anti-sigma factor